MDIMPWILAMIFWGNQWSTQGYSYQLSGPNKGYFCNAQGECRLVPMQYAPPQARSTDAGRAMVGR